jgi:hypothetical protein
MISCYEDIDDSKRRLFYTTSEHDTTTKRAKNCRLGVKARNKLARLHALEASTPILMHFDHRESESEDTE